MQYLQDTALESTRVTTPVVVEVRHNGKRGRPAIHVDSLVLQTGIRHRDQSKLARSLGISRGTLRKCLQEQGLLDCGPASTQPLPPQSLLNPGSGLSPTSSESSTPVAPPTDHETISVGFGSVPSLGYDPPSLPSTPHHSGLNSVIPSVRPLHTFRADEFGRPWSEVELDSCVLSLMQHFPNFGYRMHTAAIRRLCNVNIPYEDVRQSIRRLDPTRSFRRPRLVERRSRYHVGGPDSLWHHDGQHGKPFKLTWWIFMHSDTIP